MNITKCSRTCNISAYICIHAFPDFNAKAIEQVSHSAPSQPVALHIVVSKEQGPMLDLIDQCLSHWLQPISPSCPGHSVGPPYSQAYQHLPPICHWTWSY